MIGRLRDSWIRQHNAHRALLVFAKWSMSLSLGAGAMTIGTGTTFPQSSMQVSQDVGNESTIEQRYIVRYRAGVSERSKIRVREKLHASLLNRFSNPLLEELKVDLKNNTKGRAELNKRLECVKKDSAVQSIQPAYSYSLM
jgi:hypothetical protein